MVLDGGESLTLGNVRFIPSKEIFITNLLETVFLWIQKKIIKINNCYASFLRIRQTVSEVGPIFRPMKR